MLKLHDLLDEQTMKAVDDATPEALAANGMTIRDVLAEHADTLPKARYLAPPVSFPPWEELAAATDTLLKVGDDLRGARSELETRNSPN